MALGFARAERIREKVGGILLTGDPDEVKEAGVETLTDVAQLHIVVLAQRRLGR